MFIRNLDYISPPITLYHEGSLSHSSIVSGILSIMSFILIIAVAVYFSLDLIQRRNPSAFYYNRYIEDSGIFPMNSSSVFHFISLSLAENGFVDNGVDFNSFRVFGIETYFTSYLNDTNINHFNHWLYGLCKNGVDGEKDMLASHSYFEKSACIKKYFDVDKQKYFDIGELEFRWPAMAHGTYNNKSQYYAIILERCKEETINLILGGENNHCTTDEQLKEIIGLSSIAHMFYVDYYVDVLNYKNPNTKFLNRVENVINFENYPMNNLNFDPVLIKTHNGLVLDHIEEEEAYLYERNDVLTYQNRNDIDIYTVYCFWLNNNLKYYERTYKRIQDVISNIGGINQAITIIAIIINKLYNNYIILCDTENLLFSTLDMEKNIHKKDSNKLRASKDNKNKIFKKISEKGKISNKKKNVKDNKIINKTDSNITKSRNITFNNDNDEFDKSKRKLNELDNNSKIKVNEIITFKSKKRKYFLNYIFFKLTFGKKNSYFKMYENLRMRLLSEQHLIRNHINIYTLLKVTKSKRLSRKYSYHFNDLFQLI